MAQLLRCRMATTLSGLTLAHTYMRVWSYLNCRFRVECCQNFGYRRNKVPPCICDSELYNMLNDFELSSWLTQLRIRKVKATQDMYYPVSSYTITRLILIDHAYAYAALSKANVLQHRSPLTKCHPKTRPVRSCLS